MYSNISQWQWVSGYICDTILHLVTMSSFVIRKTTISEETLVSQIVCLTLKMKVLVLTVLFVFVISPSLQQEPVPCSSCEPRFEYDYRLLTRLIELETAQRDALTLISQLRADNVELRREVNGGTDFEHKCLTALSYSICLLITK